MSKRKQADEQALKQLKFQGVDSDLPHRVEFFLYFPTEWDAYVAATQLVNLQFQVNINLSKGAEQWLCVAANKLKPTSERLKGVSNFMEKVAVGNSGNYDGWGTPVVKEK